MKRFLLLLSLLVLCLALTACTASSAPVTPTQSPTVGPTDAPTTVPTRDMPMMTDLLPDAGLTDGPMVSADPAATGVSSAADVRQLVEKIEEELERLSEVDDAQVVLAGNSAAVALEFDDQYRGGIDDRLRKIVKERIAGVIRGVDNIVITDDTALMDQLEMLGDRLDGAPNMTDIQNELNSIINRIQSAAA